MNTDLKMRALEAVANSAIGAATVDVSSADQTFPRPTRAVWVGTGGDVALVFWDGTSAVLANVPTGALLPVAVKTVLKTGTDASDIVALF